MKEYFVFKLRKEYTKLYKNKASELFYIFNRIYYMKEIDKMYGYNLFEQISEFYDYTSVNNFLFNKYKEKIMYSFTNDEHIINNLFLNEISILRIKSSNLRIQTNREDCTFLKDLKEYSNDLFVCNFKEQEYFFLKDYKIKVKN